MENTKEEWRDVVGYEGLYQVSSLGRVKSMERRVPHGLRGSVSVRERILRPHKTAKGHIKVWLSRGRKKKMFFIHRLVLEAFVCLRPDGLQCCHNDGNPENNVPDNLRWDTMSGNQQDRLLHGTDFRGEKSPVAKLSNFGVRVIKRLLERGSMTQKEIAEVFGVKKACIGSISCGTTWGWMNNG